jgi:hypothetical protein
MTSGSVAHGARRLTLRTSNAHSCRIWLVGHRPAQPTRSGASAGTNEAEGMRSLFLYKSRRMACYQTSASQDNYITIVALQCQKQKKSQNFRPGDEKNDIATADTSPKIKH